MGRSPSALLIILEPELDDNQDITAIQSEPDPVVGQERGDIEQSTTPLNFTPQATAETYGAFQELWPFNP